jgi:hypothetical protein
MKLFIPKLHLFIFLQLVLGLSANAQTCAAGKNNYKFVSQSYSQNGGTDAVQNVVWDTCSGVRWRRCSEGQLWTGSACVGEVRTVSHESAFHLARNSIQWRLPNVKELQSLVLYYKGGGWNFQQDYIDVSAFPGTPHATYWSQTPFVSDSAQAWTVLFDVFGPVVPQQRTSLNAVRLVSVQ